MKELYQRFFTKAEILRSSTYQDVLWLW